MDSSVPLSDITWVVTDGISGAGSVLIQMTFTAGAPTLNQDSCPEGSGAEDPNLTSPMELFGTISSSSLMVVGRLQFAGGQLQFHELIITGTFSDALIDEGSGQTTALESTATNGLNLTRQ